MTLAITWSDKDIQDVKKVLNNDYGDVTVSTVNLTDHFIQAVNTGADIRSQYQAAVLSILHVPAQIIYFVRELTKAKIMLRYAEVPEFKSLVQFYYNLVRSARCA